MTLTADANHVSLAAAIHPALTSALAAKGYSQLTPVQLEMANGGQGEADLLVSAQTGSGKTVAFGIAIATCTDVGEKIFRPLPEYTSASVTSIGPIFSVGSSIADVVPTLFAACPATFPDGT